MSSHANPDIVTDGLAFIYDTGSGKSYKGEPVVNIWSVQSGGNVNSRTSWDTPKAYNGDITDAVYTGGTWSGNRIWEVLHTAGTSGYGGWESWRLCVSQPTAGSSYSSTRRVAIKICILEGSISDLAIHSGGGNSSHNSSYFTAIPESQVPRDCPIKSGWYQFLATANWNSTTVAHCVGLGFITYNRVKILTTEPMYYPSDHLIPFTGTERSTTQGLLDLTKNETITLSNMSYDSNAQMSFDGTDDQFLISNPGVGTSFSIETVIKVDSYSNGPIFISPNSVGIDHFFRVNSNGAIRANFVEIADSSNDGYTSTTLINTGEYYHVVISKTPSNGTIYVNGVAEDSHTPTLAAAAWSGDWRIGARWNNTYNLNGEIPILKVYNKALTASEVLQSYNAIKDRFIR
jgi:hypothetical protein